MDGLPYFYNAQIRTILLHFVRMFSGFKIKTGPDSNGYAQYISVPSMLGMGDRQAHYIINQNSENTTLSVPRITSYVTAMTIARDRASWAGNTEDLLVSERKYDREEEQYTNNHGRDYHVKRLMYNPLDITMQVDILTSNMDQKCQLFEQIYLLFNPMVEMQIYSNPLHWTPIKRVTLEDITWDAQSFPRGTSEEENILSMSFKIEADINPPAKLKRQTLINSIIKEIGDGNSFDDMLEWNDSDVTYSIVTPENHAIKVENNQIILLGPYKNLNNINNEQYSWPQLIDLYGELIPGSSKIKLIPMNGLTSDNDIIGYINFHPTIDNTLIFQIDKDTLPSETQSAIDKFIDPHIDFPGGSLPIATIGQRYILKRSLGANSSMWGSINAEINDIIEYDGSEWNVVLDASITSTDEIILDTDSGVLYRLVSHEWNSVIEDYYLAGYWRLII